MQVGTMGLKANRRWYGCWLWLLALLVVGCSGAPAAGESPGAHAEELSLPDLSAVDLGGEPLRVVATTSVIGNVVAQVGGEAIVLTTLLGPGQDSHSYQPAARDLTAVAEADVIFVNGWNLEEALIGDLTAIAGDTPLVPVSANIEPIVAPEGHEEAEHTEAEPEHAGADPHTWLDPHNVQQWVDNIEQVLSQLDPANAAVYQANADAYHTQLDELLAKTEAQIATLPAEKRKLITNHDSLAYFARAYGFEVIGTVIPGISTLAEPSASELASLARVMEAEGVCTIFAETTMSDQLARTVAAEVGSCDTVQVLTLYTEALGAAGSGADSYLGMMRADVATIVTGLQ